MSTKPRLLACAIDELEKSGLDGFSLRAVGVAAGLTPMAVYRHFRNRDELLAAAGDEAFAAWKARIDDIASGDPLDWLRQLGRAYIEFALDQPARFDACFVLRTSVERRYPDDFRAGKSPVVALAVERIKEAQASRSIPAADPLEAAMLLWAQVHGLAMLHRAGRFAMDREPYLALGERCVDQVMAGMGKTL